MIKPTGRLGITGAVSTSKLPHKTFETPFHSEHRAKISADYHGKAIDKLNPSEALANATRYPQTGRGG